MGAGIRLKDDGEKAPTITIPLPVDTGDGVTMDTGFPVRSLHV